MKKNGSKWALVAALMCGAVSAQAQTATQPSQVKITNAAAERDRKAGMAKVRMDVDFTPLRVYSNRTVVFTPMIVSANGEVTRDLPSVVLNGRKRSIIRQRVGEKHAPAYQALADTVLRRYNKATQVLPYNVTVPYESWMTRANVVVRQDMYGCADCHELADTLPAVLTGVFTPLYPEQFFTAQLMPAAELRKERSEKFAATFTYKVNRTELLTNYADNARKLAEVDTVIATIKAKPNATVSYIDIAGYASPEGSTDGNVRLSKGRAEAFQKYLMGKHKLGQSQMRVSWYGSDWDGLLAVLDKGEILAKEDCDYLANLIRTGNRDDKMRKQLINYKYSVPYVKLLNEIYPLLRRNEYTVSYSVGLFDLEQARRVIHTHPELMSLHEMYTVASSYPKGSAEQVKAFEIAYKFFPDAPENRISRSEQLIDAGKYDEALALLEGLTQPEANNNRGVCYAKQEKPEQALPYFEAAAKAGNQPAAMNLKQLQEYLAQ